MGLLRKQKTYILTSMGIEFGMSKKLRELQQHPIFVSASFVASKKNDFHTLLNLGIQTNIHRKYIYLVFIQMISNKKHV